MQSPPVDERIQSRPLPAPPAPPRNMKKKSASIESEEGRGSRNSDRSCGDVTNTENFRTCAESLNTSKTLRGNSSREEDDITLAESVVDSLVSCAETLVGENDNLETCVDTLTGGDTEFFSDDDDNPYPSVNFDKAGANIVEDEREGRSLAKKREVQKSESKFESNYQYYVSPGDRSRSQHIVFSSSHIYNIYFVSKGCPILTIK